MPFGYPLQALIWDALILLLIVGSVWSIVKLFLYIKHGAWRGFRISVIILIIVLCVGCMLTVYGSFIEPRIITVATYDVTFPMEEELTIVLFSDLHLGPYKRERYLERLVASVNALEPDLVLMTGDFFYSSRIDPALLHPLADLRSRYGVFASLGNYAFGQDIHWFLTGKESPDVSGTIQRTFERLGVTVLRNNYAEVQTGSGSVFIGGVDDPSSGHDLIRDALPEIRRGLPIILLSHSPDIILQAEARRPHLIVSGHTHGGQIRLPFIGALMGMPIQLGSEYAWGAHAIDDDSTIVITRGAGETGVRARLFAWPEVVVIRAKR